MNSLKLLLKRRLFEFSVWDLEMFIATPNEIATEFIIKTEFYFSLHTPAISLPPPPLGGLIENHVEINIK